MDEINRFLGLNLNSCLINYYPDGNSNIGHHSDGKGYKLGSYNSVATISLGTSRMFEFKKKTDSSTIRVQLDNGDLVLMYNECQKLATHSILKDKTIKDPRISLTFME